MTIDHSMDDTDPALYTIAHNAQLGTVPRLQCKQTECMQSSNGLICSFLLVGEFSKVS